MALKEMSSGLASQGLDMGFKDWAWGNGRE